jgi:hypothetical protein
MPISQKKNRDHFRGSLCFSNGDWHIFKNRIVSLALYYESGKKNSRPEKHKRILIFLNKKLVLH